LNAPGLRNPGRKSKMPQFYPSDDLVGWFATCFTEHYEALDESDAKTFAFDVIEENEHIDKAEEFLRNCNLDNDTLVDAILHSVDWEDVIERFKRGIDYWEPETRTCYKCSGIYTHETEEADKEDTGFCGACLEKINSDPCKKCYAEAKRSAAESNNTLPLSVICDCD
jgi:hypothetical protein